MFLGQKSLLNTSTAEGTLLTVPAGVILPYCEDLIQYFKLASLNCKRAQYCICVFYVYE